MEDASLVDRVGERLLHIYVLARSHRSSSDRRVSMIRGRDQDRLDVALLLEHDAEVRVLRRARILLLPAQALFARRAVATVGTLLDLGGHQIVVEITYRHDVLRAEFLRVLATHPAGSHYGDVEGVTRRLMAHATEHSTRNDHGAHGELRAVRDEVPAGDLVGHGPSLSKDATDKIGGREWQRYRRATVDGHFRGREPLLLVPLTPLDPLPRRRALHRLGDHGDDLVPGRRLREVQDHLVLAQAAIVPVAFDEARDHETTA